jgi:uncharacterized membrane protein YkvA (DUF1232 family)
MPGWLIAVLVVVVLYAGLLLTLVVTGRRVEARELAVLLPNLVLLFRDLVRDPAVPRGPKVWLVLAGIWLVSPIDLLPEFLPVVGPLDDAIVAALVLRHLVRRTGVGTVRAHWRGDPATLDRLLRAARIATG